MPESTIEHNELARAGRRMLEGTRTNTTIHNVDSAVSKIGTRARFIVKPARNVVVERFLDPFMEGRARQCMSWLVDSSYYPEFVNDNNTATEALSQSAVDPPSIDPDPARVPPRMFNIDTGNLEEGLNANNVGMYCILSHCWKGCEIDYAYVSKVKERDKKRTKYEGMLAAGHEFAEFAIQKYSYLDNYDDQTHIGSDVERLEAQSDEDIKLQIQKINAVIQRLRLPIPGSNDRHDNVRALLKIFAEHKREGRENNGDAFFNKFKPLRYVVEEMFSLMQQRKSADKIKYTILSAKEILDRRIFPHTEKRYLWIDTCCINKAIIGEHVDTLARMGEWYTNAEFCLVHLDSGKTDKEWDKWEEWVKEWDHIEKPNFASFDEIRTPSWATRGWTLQELVLSKITFYVNDLWEPLDRPVENLGRYYHLCSFLDEYISGTLDDDETEDSKITAERNLHRDEYNMKRALNVIGILNFLGIEFPNDIDDAAEGLTGNWQKDNTLHSKPTPRQRRDLVQSLRFTSPEWPIKFLINTLIEELVIVTKDAIKRDKQLIGKFSDIPASESCRGNRRSRLSAFEVIHRASRRECTVQTDQAYSLMGILGVKFAAFHAEGLTKALSRLIDEIVIASNDVSVFNWSGSNLGSPIKGRSLYPSNLDAFTKEKRTENGHGKTSKDIHFLADAYSNASAMLRRIIKHTRANKQKNKSADAMELVLNVIKKTDLSKLAPRLEILRKTLEYAEAVVNDPDVNYQEVATIKKFSSLWLSKSSEKPPKESSSKEAASGSRFRTLPFMRKGKARENIDTSGSHEEITSSHISGDFNNADTNQHEQMPELFENHSKTKESELDSLISYLYANPDYREIPDNVKLILKENSGLGPEASTEPPPLPAAARPNSLPNKSMVSPNPIIVNTSGIEGVFDIQRTVITMENPEKLWSQVRHAANPNQRISGRCTISTGLAATTVSFSCGRDVLKKQLHVSDVIERTVLNVDPTKEKGLQTLQKRHSKSDIVLNVDPNNEKGLTTLTLQKTLSKSDSVETDSSLDDVALTPDITPSDERQSFEMPNDVGGEEVNPPSAVGDDNKQRRVSRMLEFVQESNINVVAGEWVLVKFSGVPKAKWFLCLLELGSTHNYYGYRISTDEIDFQNASPEKGLIEHWRAYLTKKKDELCTIAKLLFDRKKLHTYRKMVEKEIVEDDSKIIKDSSNHGTKAAGAFTAYKDSILSENVLRAMPRHLRAAILNLDENADMLPAMFLPAINVHMF
ncbi:hypothetical protein V8E54_008712 [Elaphomyces granulatus]